jgi:hypothetical protein
MAPNTRGRVVVRFTIDPTGKVVDSAIEHTDIPLKGLNQCMKKKAMHLKFPEFDDDPLQVTMVLAMGAECGGDG